MTAAQAQGQIYLETKVTLRATTKVRPRRCDEEILRLFSDSEEDDFSGFSEQEENKDAMSDLAWKTLCSCVVVGVFSTSLFQATFIYGTYLRVLAVPI